MPRYVFVNNTDRTLPVDFDGESYEFAPGETEIKPKFNKKLGRPVSEAKDVADHAYAKYVNLDVAVKTVKFIGEK